MRRGKGCPDNSDGCEVYLTTLCECMVMQISTSDLSLLVTTLKRWMKLHLLIKMRRLATEAMKEN